MVRSSDSQQIVSPLHDATNGAVPPAPEQAVAQRKRGGQLGNANAGRHNANRRLEVDPKWRRSLRERARRDANRRAFGMPRVSKQDKESQPEQAQQADMLMELYRREIQVGDVLDRVTQDVLTRGAVNADGEPRRVVDTFARLMTTWLRLKEALAETVPTFVASRRDYLAGSALAKVRYGDGSPS